MASQGPNFPAFAESTSSSDANEVTWTTPANIQDADADEATITAATFDAPDPSFYLRGTQFGFSIPAGSTIDGIEVTINRRSIIANSGIDLEVHIHDGTTGLVGDNKADLVTVWPSTATDKVYGGPTDTWNTGLTNQQLLDAVNNTNFAVYLQAAANIANADIGVAYFKVTIYYTAGAPPAAVANALMMVGSGI